VPYGDHVPWLGRSDNGKTAQAAVVYDILGNGEVVARYAPLVAAAWDDRETGHSGNFFSYTWGPLGAVRAGRPALAELFKHQHWYYDLARHWSHGLITQPTPEITEGMQGMTNYVGGGPPWGTGGMALVFALPQAKLRILGAPPSVFGLPPPAPLRLAAAHFKKKQFAACRDALRALAESPHSALRQAVSQLSTAADHAAASRQLTLAAVESDLAAGDPYLASCRLSALEHLTPAGDTDFQRLQKKLAAAADPALLDVGRQFYESCETMHTSDYRFVPRYTAGNRSRAARGPVRFSANSRCFRRNGWTENTDLSP
jgi:hypothetical protein